MKEKEERAGIAMTASGVRPGKWMCPTRAKVTSLPSPFSLSIACGFALIAVMDPKCVCAHRLSACFLRSRACMTYDIGKLPWAAVIVEMGRDVVKYVRGHEWSNALVRDIAKSGSKKEMLQPGDTRFGTQFLMLSRLVEKKEDLLKAVEHDVWKEHMPKQKKVGARAGSRTSPRLAAKSRSKTDGRVQKPTRKAMETEEAVQQNKLGKPKSAKQKMEEGAKRVRDLVKDEDMCERLSSWWTSSSL